MALITITDSERKSYWRAVSGGGSWRVSPHSALPPPPPPTPTTPAQLTDNTNMDFANYYVYIQHQFSNYGVETAAWNRVSISKGYMYYYTVRVSTNYISCLYTNYMMMYQATDILDVAILHWVLPSITNNYSKTMFEIIQNYCGMSPLLWRSRGHMHGVTSIDTPVWRRWSLTCSESDSTPTSTHALNASTNIKSLPMSSEALVFKA